ncbi:MAG TPA: hypothetical protein VHA80_04095 [Solirubrobacterales bacterium]|nr:hypothetical protein [Solirubrobacterales bacterium]
MKLRWIGLAVLGLVIAAAVAIAAGTLASRQIGIASESVSAGDSLAPPITSSPKARPERDDQSSHPPRQTEGAGKEPPQAESPAPPPESSAPPPAESGEDDGEGGGRDD